MTMMPQAAPRPLFPVAGRTLLFTVLLSGLAADLVWEIWARGITPLLVGGPLQPAALVQSVFGFRNWPLAEAIHAFVGVVCSSSPGRSSARCCPDCRSCSRARASGSGSGSSRSM